MLPAALPESLQTIFMMEDSMIVGPYKWPLQVWVMDIALSVLILTGGYFYITRVLVSTPGAWPAKRKAWVLAAMNATVCSLASLRYIHSLVVARFDTAMALYADDRLSRFVTVFFIISMILDLTLGLVEYPAQIQLLTGWVHHTLYIGLASWTLWGNFSMIATAVLAIEVPTLILALGHLNKEYRADKLFGFSFLALRICYFGRLTLSFYIDLRDKIPLWYFACGIMGLHVHWFMEWIRQQKRLSRKRAQERAGDDAMIKAAPRRLAAQ